MAKLRLNIFSIALYNYYFGAIIIMLGTAFAILSFGFLPIQHILSGNQSEIKTRNANISKNRQLISKYENINKAQVEINEYMQKVPIDKKIFTNFKQEDLFVVPQVFEEKFSKLDIQLKSNNPKNLTNGNLSELIFSMKYKHETFNDKVCWESVQFLDKSLAGFIVIDDYGVSKDKEKVVCNITLTWTFLTD